MYNCLVIGAGRSGTSMLTGSLAGSYYVGKCLIPPRNANPKGFFESSIINNTNEAILQEKLPKLVHGQRWLGILDLKNTENFNVKPNIVEQIKCHTGVKGFCYKDPRFCYTLPVWRPHLTNTKFICIFRHPLNMVASVLKECSIAPYLRKFKISKNIAQEIWKEMYLHVIKRHRHSGEWKFVHYNQLFEQKTLLEIEDFLEAKVNRSFPDKKLNRSKAVKMVLSKETKRIYRTLCDLAEYSNK